MRKYKTLSDIGEFGLIKILSRSLHSAKAVVSVGDDTAVMSFNKKKYLLMTTDMLVEGVHFTPKTHPKLIGQKALNCNISDIAAMGGVPKYAVVSIGVNPQDRIDKIKDIYKGINLSAKKFNVGIVGGDTVKHNKLTINIALIGEVRKTDLVLRSKAKVGDQIFVTGRLGHSYQSDRHLTFVPRVAEAQFLVKRYRPTSMIDISDGLMPDLQHIITSSQTGAQIYENRIPLHSDAQLKQALFEGEDFELLFTLNRTSAKKLCKYKGAFKFYHIGEITKKGLSIVCQEQSQITVKGKGYRHF